VDIIIAIFPTEVKQIPQGSRRHGVGVQYILDR
jgi:hypothetical protein